MVSRHNQSAKAELIRQKKAAKGLVSECFPEVQDMVIQMTYRQNAPTPVLMLRTVNVSPTSYAYFTMDCMNKGCTNGGFELTRVIKDMVRERQKIQRGTAPCCGDNKELELNHANISYEITIRYNKRS